MTDRERASEARRRYQRERRKARTPEQIAKDRAYKKAWDKANREKIKAYNEKYWLKKAQEYEAQGQAENEGTPV